MGTVDKIIKTATAFYNDLKADPNGRYRSWEYCYKHFYDARNNADADVDILSLHLAFYLASWGMYRGSSFLLQKDYRVHIPVVEELLNPKYNSLIGIECKQLKNEDNQKLLQEITDFMSNYYNGVRLSVKEDTPQNDVSMTLITKVLMGALGCVPAYDRYFIAGIKNEKVSTGNYNIKSVIKLVDFYEANFDKLEKARNGMTIDGIPYPQMKMLDMGFWQIGFEMDTEKGLQKAH